MQKISISKQQVYVLLPVVCTLLISIFLIEYSVFEQTGGKFIYPLDDTYIHMSIAKNLAFHNNWGISQNEFQSASSSVLYTLLLSGLFKLFSANILIPFVINLIASIALLFVIQKWLQKQGLGYAWQLCTLLLVIFFTPLPTLVISGMEHTLQCVFSFLFIFIFSDWIGGFNKQSKQNINLPTSLYVYGMLVCTIRYEGLFIIAIACCILLYKKRIITAFLLGFVSILPLILFGIVSVAKGSYFLPNSVLLKANPIELANNSGVVSFIGSLLIDKLTLATSGITALATQRLLLILPLLYLLFRNQLKQSSYSFIILFITICTLLQLAFAKTGWFYRYEAYLIVCSIVIICVLLARYLKDLRWRKNKLLLPVFAFTGFFLFFPLILRSAAAYSKAKQACINIYDQQYQMSKFVKAYYNNNIVALNDIGAVAFYSNAKVVDLWGLANMDVAKAKKQNTNTPDFLNEITAKNKVKLAILYDTWFDSVLLNKWKKVGTWQMPNNVICGSDIVSFYSITDEDYNNVRSNLEKYESSLPKEVIVKYY